MKKQDLMLLYSSIFKEETKEIEKIKLNYDLASYFRNITENEVKIIGMFYAELDENLGLLEYLINNFKYNSEYEECVLNYAKGIYFASTEKRDYIMSGKYLLKALEYVETHNQKIIINDENYGRNFKAMVQYYVGYYYFKINKTYKAIEYVTKAKEIFTYKTKNIMKSITCNALLGSIYLRRGNTFEARKHFRQIERVDIELGSLAYDMNNNLLYLYYIEENYEECDKRISIAIKKIENYSLVNQYYFYMYAGLVKFITGEYVKSKEFIGKSLDILENISIYKVDEKDIYRKMLTIVTSPSPTKDDINYLKKVFIPHVVDKDVYDQIFIISRYIDEWGN